MAAADKAESAAVAEEQSAAAAYHAADALVVGAAERTEAAMRALAQTVLDGAAGSPRPSGDTLERTMGIAVADADAEKEAAIAAERLLEQRRRRGGRRYLPGGCFVSECSLDTSAAERHHEQRPSYITRRRMFTTARQWAEAEGSGGGGTATAQLNATARCDACGEADFDIEVGVQLRRRPGSGAAAGGVRPVLRPKSIHFNERLVWRCTLEPAGGDTAGGAAADTQRQHKAVLSASDTSLAAGQGGGETETGATNGTEQAPLAEKPPASQSTQPSDTAVQPAQSDGDGKEEAMPEEQQRQSHEADAAVDTEQAETETSASVLTDTDAQSDATGTATTETEQSTLTHSSLPPSSGTADSTGTGTGSTPGTHASGTSEGEPSGDTTAADSAATGGTRTSAASEGDASSASLPELAAGGVERSSSMERWKSADAEDMRTARSPDASAEKADANGEEPADGGHKAADNKGGKGDKAPADYSGVVPDA